MKEFELFDHLKNNNEQLFELLEKYDDKVNEL